MSENLAYVLGALCTWVGWGLGIWALLRLVLLVMPGGSSDRGRALVPVLVSGVIAAIALIVGSRLPTFSGPAPAEGTRIPLVWFVMPLSAWLAVATLLMAIVRAAQGLQQILPSERATKYKSAVLWAIGFIVCIVLFRRGSDPIQVLKGSIELRFSTAIAIVLLVVAGSVAMTLAGRQVGSRGWSKAIATHAMLIAGSIVFGLPFAFLVVTSFKEDRDMSSPNGIVWIPHVQQTVPYFDKKDPLLKGRFQDRPVQGSIIQTYPDGRVQLEIVNPASMRGLTFDAARKDLEEIPKQAPIVTASLDGRPIQGEIIENLLDGKQRVLITRPSDLAGKEHLYQPSETQPVREIGLRWQNYTEALEYLPPETANGLVYLKNTLIIVLLSVIGTVLSSSVVAYAFARMKFPGQNLLFAILLATMMLPGAVTLLPKFLIFRSLGWVDTLYPLWVPAFFASAFNVFLLRQFFKGIPAELEDAAKIDGCSPGRTFWSVMLPLVKPALAVIAIWGFLNAWNNFMEPLIYISSPEKMPLSYALQLFQSDRQNEPGLLMAFATMTMVPVLLLFFFAQRYFVEGVTLSGLGGR